MKLRYLALALTMGCLVSCSSARRAQTTDGDDGGYIANDGSDDRVQQTYSTADNYNQYAYGDDYSPFTTYSSPFWGMGFGMGMGFGYGMSYGYGFGNPYFSPFYNPYYGMGYSWGFYHVSPAYYGGYYNPYYPGFGYYGVHPYYATSSVYPSLYTGASARVGVLAYNNRHFNSVTTTVATQGGVLRPVAGGTVSGRVPVSLTNNKVATNGWQNYRVNTDNGRLNNRSGTVSRQNSAANARPIQPNNTRTVQPTYRPAQSQSSFGRSSGSFGGGGGGGRVGGGGGFGRGH
jgi:hypothetical protein